MPEEPDRNLALDMVRVTEAAAIAADRITYYVLRITNHEAAGLEPCNASL